MLRSRAAAAFGVLLAVSVLGCRRPSSETASATKSGGDVLDVYLASDTPEGELLVQRVGPDGEKLYLAASPLVAGRDLVRATRSVSTDGRPALILDATEEAAATLRDASDAYVGRMLAFVWRGQVVYAPYVRGPLSSKLMIVGGTDILPDDQLDAIAARVDSHASAHARSNVASQ
jgi:preprotein translocase subunit SecD